MKTCLVTFAFCACLALAAADVSHLSSSYLPPPKPEQLEHMTIEQHELRELPEQVDYMRDNEQGVMELTPSSQLTPPAMPEGEQMLANRYLPPAETVMPEMDQMPAMPATRYLPPAQPTQRAEPEPEPMMQPEMMPEQAMEYMPPVEPQTEVEPQPQPQAAPAMRYLPPVQQPEQPQYTYQQYQEMPYILDVQQPTAPSDAESSQLAFEPEPAHELRNDGYHYKQAAEEQRLRH